MSASLYELYKNGESEELKKRMGDFDRLETQCKGNKERLLSVRHNKVLAEHLLSSSASSSPPSSKGSTREGSSEEEDERASAIAAKLSELYAAAKAAEAGVSGLIEYNLAVAQAGLGTNRGNYEALRTLQGLFVRIDDIEYWLACRVCLFLAQMYRRTGMPSSLGLAVLRCLETYAENRRTLPKDVLQAATDPREVPYERLMRMIAVERSRLNSSCNDVQSVIGGNVSDNEEAQVQKPTLKDIRKEKDPLRMNVKLGAFYSDTGKPKLALICASKVLSMKGGDTPDMRYRAGLQLLCVGKPKKAFFMLCGASRAMSGNPEYWLRLSECCVLRHLRKLRRLGVYSYSAPFSLSSPAAPGGSANNSSGSGIGSNSNNNNNNSGDTKSLRIEFPRRGLCKGDYVLEKGPSLAFGAKCCRNALMSLRSQTRAMASGQACAVMKLLALGANKDREFNIGNARQEVIRQNALVNLAWISLCMGDMVSAAKAAGEVLRAKPQLGVEGEKNTKILRFLACMYMAEIAATSEEGAAMACAMNREERSRRVDALLGEAMGFAEDVSTAGSGSGTEPLFERVQHADVSDLNVVLNAVWTDYGVARVLVDRDLKKSFECFKKANELYKLSQHTILLQTYLASLLNNFGEARDLLKKG